MIELKSITKKFGKFTAVDNVNFSIKDGEIVGFLGRNGAGKTTTMKLIMGLLDPTEGKILMNEKPLTIKSRAKIGYMPENAPLYQDMTVREFIKFMCELKGVKKAERAEAVNKLIKNLALEEVADKLTKNLSKGYKQRTSLAGALAGNPEILILDEPTAGLDPKQIIEIRNLIKSLRRDHTIFISSHILSEIDQICERVIIIDNGKIIAEDSPENLEKKIDKNAVIIDIDDKSNNIEKIKEDIKSIEEINFIKRVDDNVKEYEIVAEKGVDIRKKLFEILPKFEISIIELRNASVSLEDAFINLINKGGEQ